MAADLLVAHGCSSQIKKWLVLYDEDGRDLMPAKEGDMMVYLSYRYMEGREG